MCWQTLAPEYGGSRAQAKRVNKPTTDLQTNRGR
jgi:hypothetical protein